MQEDSGAGSEYQTDIREYKEAAMIKYDNLDEAIIGHASVWDGNDKVERVIYSGEKMIDLFMQDGMSELDAIEWIEFNMEGAYLGKETPVIVWECEDD